MNKVTILDNTEIGIMINTTEYNKNKILATPKQELWSISGNAARTKFWDAPKHGAAITEGNAIELTSNNRKNDAKSGQNVCKNGYKNGENRKKQNIQERLSINKNRENGETNDNNNNIEIINNKPWIITAQNMQRFVTTY